MNRPTDASGSDCHDFVLKRPKVLRGVVWLLSATFRVPNSLRCPKCPSCACVFASTKRSRRRRWCAVIFIRRRSAFLGEYEIPIVPSTCFVLRHHVAKLVPDRTICKRGARTHGRKGLMMPHRTPETLLLTPITANMTLCALRLALEWKSDFSFCGWPERSRWQGRR